MASLDKNHLDNLPKDFQGKIPLFQAFKSIPSKEWVPTAEILTQLIQHNEDTEALPILLEVLPHLEYSHWSHFFEIANPIVQKYNHTPHLLIDLLRTIKNLPPNEWDTWVELMDPLLKNSIDIRHFNSFICNLSKF